MTSLCHEFELWLESLPEGELPPHVRLHLKTCDRCAAEYLSLLPVVKALVNGSGPQLNMSFVDKVAIMAREETRHVEQRRLLTRLCIIVLLTLPLVVAINWLWAMLCFAFLSTYVSTIIASIFLTIFLTTVAGLSGITFGSIPLIAAWVRGVAEEELMQ